jgi:hypothetical protein
LDAASCSSVIPSSAILSSSDRLSGSRETSESSIGLGAAAVALIGLGSSPALSSFRPAGVSTFCSLLGASCLTWLAMGPVTLAFSVATWPPMFCLTASNGFSRLNSLASDSLCGSFCSSSVRLLLSSALKLSG